VTTSRTCPAGRLLPIRYVEQAARSRSRNRPQLTVAAALRDFDLDEHRAVPDIAAAHGMPERTLRDYARRAGIPPRAHANVTRRVSDAELLRTVELVNELGTQARAAQALGLHQTTVGERLDRAGHRSTRNTTRNA
jgi:hypothetical protein